MLYSRANNHSVESNLFYVLEINLDGVYTFMNDKFKSRFNDENYAVGNVFMNTVLPVHHEICSKTIEQCLSNPYQSFTVNLSKPVSDGIITNQWELTAILGSDGEPEGILFIGYEVKNLVVEARKLKTLASEVALERDRAHSMLSRIIHDLRSPVATLKSLMNLFDLQKEAEPDSVLSVDNIKSLIKEIDEKIKSLSGAYNIVLDPSSFTFISLDTILTALLSNSLKEISRDKVDVEIDLIANEVYSNTEFIESIFTLLLKSSLNNQSEERKLKIEISSLTVGEMIELRFKDNGLGLDLSQHKFKSINPYAYLNSESTFNLGLNLFIIESQVKQLGGAMSIESKIGEFLDVRISLPFVEKPAQSQ